MKLPVYLYGHPVLRKLSEPVGKDYPDLSQLIDDMYACMYESDGIGLAAPQIGRNIKLIVIDASPLGEDFPECAGRRMTLVNPELEVLDGPKEVRAEGCLSLPGKHALVTRPNYVKIRAFDRNMEPFEAEGEELLARAILHEYDHLEGIMYVDIMEGELEDVPEEEE